LRIRPLHLVLAAVAAGGVYSIVSVVASFAEIKAVGERATEAAQARARRTPRAETVPPPGVARGEAERRGSLEPVVVPPAAPPEPNAVLERDDAAVERLDAAALDNAAALEVEERYLADRDLRDTQSSDLDDAEPGSILAPANEDEQNIALHDIEPSFDDAGDEATDDDAAGDEPFDPAATDEP
jgi:hypothetical protein